VLGEVGEIGVIEGHSAIWMGWFNPRFEKPGTKGLWD